MKSPMVRVERRGQVTIPSDLRDEFGLVEGSGIRVRRENNGILLEMVQPIEGGKVVGRKEYRRVLGELEGLRSNWRRRE